MRIVFPPLRSHYFFFLRCALVCLAALQNITLSAQVKALMESLEQQRLLEMLSKSAARSVFVLLICRA